MKVEIKLTGPRGCGKSQLAKELKNFFYDTTEKGTEVTCISHLVEGDEGEHEFTISADEE